MDPKLSPESMNTEGTTVDVVPGLGGVACTSTLETVGDPVTETVLGNGWDRTPAGPGVG